MKLAAMVMLLACLVTAGCSPALDLPAGFVEVDRENLGPYAQRAVSGDGVVIAIRSEPNPRNAALDFWVTAVSDELVNRRGYAPARQEALSASDGTPGRLLVFTAQRSGAEFTYMTAIYVKGSRVLLAEAGGKTQAVAPKAEAIRKGLTSLRMGLL